MNGRNAKHERYPSVQELKGAELKLEDLDTVSGGDLLATTLSNIANLRHDMQKTIANNIRA